MIRLPLDSTLFPYTTLFRSLHDGDMPDERKLLVDHRHAAAPGVERSARRVRRAVEQHLTLIGDRKSTRLNSSHVEISYADFCLKKKIWCYCWRYCFCSCWWR